MFVSSNIPLSALHVRVSVHGCLDIYNTQLFLCSTRIHIEIFLSRLVLRVFPVPVHASVILLLVLHSAIVVTATLALSHVAAPVAFVPALPLTTVAFLGRGALGFLVGPASLFELRVSLPRTATMRKLKVESTCKKKEFSRMSKAP